MAESGRFNLTFENGGYWEYYNDIERQFQEFLGFVPYISGNEKTFSFRLANIMLAIGAHIDSALKKIAEDPFFSDKYPQMINPKIKKGPHKGELRDQELIDYFPISEEYKLYERSVSFKCLPDREEVFPFKEYRKEIGKVPYWWTAYNGIKHNVSINLSKADLRTTRDALAGAFLLNVIHLPAYIRLMEYRFVKPQAGFGFTLKGNWKDSLKKIIIEKDKKFGFIETSLFMFDFETQKS